MSEQAGGGKPSPAVERLGKAVRGRSQGVLSPWRAESLQGSELSSVKAVTGLNNLDSPSSYLPRGPYKDSLIGSLSESPESSPPHPLPITQRKVREDSDGESGPGFPSEQKSIWQQPDSGSLMSSLLPCVAILLVETTSLRLCVGQYSKPRKRKTFVVTDYVQVSQAQLRQNSLSERELV